MLTEKQAKEKWCPFARQGAFFLIPPGPLPTTTPDVWSVRGNTCIASECMAWRWGDGEFTNEPEHVKRPLKDQRRGFCGLAGPVQS